MKGLYPSLRYVQDTASHSSLKPLRFKAEGIWGRHFQSKLTVLYIKSLAGFPDITLNVYQR